MHIDAKKVRFVVKEGEGDIFIMLEPAEMYYQLPKQVYINMKPGTDMETAKKICNILEEHVDSLGAE